MGLSLLMMMVILLRDSMSEIKQLKRQVEVLLEDKQRARKKAYEYGISLGKKIRALQHELHEERLAYSRLVKEVNTMYIPVEKDDD